MLGPKQTTEGATDMPGARDSDLRVFGRTAPSADAPILPNAVLGTLMFVFVESMLFAGFISAFVIVKANFAPGTWPPPDQPRLPLLLTFANSLVLVASGVLAWYAGRRFRDAPTAARSPLFASAGLGAAFVSIQGFEWVRLIGQGLTLSSSTYGSFFYLIVGAHALHAIPAIGALGVVANRLQRGTLTDEAFTAARVFWYFVVLVWPVLVWKVYL